MTGITLSSDVSNARTLVDNFILQDVLYRAGGQLTNYYYAYALSDSPGAIALSETGDKILVGALYDDIGDINTGYAELHTLIPNTNSWVPKSFNNKDALPDATGDEYGTSVTIVGNLMAVSARGEDDPRYGYRKTSYGVTVFQPAAGGAVYIYEFNGITWKYTQTLRSDDDLPNTPGGDEEYISTRFGGQVIIHDNQILVSMPQAKKRHTVYYTSGSRLGQIKTNIVYPYVGAVFVFEKINGVWTKIQRLSPDWVLDNSNYSYQYGLNFGSTLACHGDHMVIGAPGYTFSLNYNVRDDVGAVFFATKDNSGVWTINQRIIVPKLFNITDSQLEDSKFGASVAIFNNVAVVGAYKYYVPKQRDDVSWTPKQGAAFIFHYENNTWVLKKSLTEDPYDSINFFYGHQFGRAVAIEDDIIVISAAFSGAIKGKSGVGQIYIFRLIDGLWQKIQSIIRSPVVSALGDYFGEGVQLKNKTLVVTSQNGQITVNKVTYRGSLSVYKFVDQGDTEPPEPPSMEWGIVSNLDAVNEGAILEVTVYSNYSYTNLAIPYTITGVDPEDIGIPLNGIIPLYSGQYANLQIPIIADETTEGPEYLTITCDTINVTKTFTINDTSVPGPIYYIEANKQSVNEGESFDITFKSFNVAPGEVVEYIISGVSSGDINDFPLAGSFTTGDPTTVTITTTVDFTTEGDEIFTMTLPDKNSTVSVTIVDTSKTQIYNLTANEPSVNEGEQFLITLTTENIAEGSAVPYVITGVSSDDISGESLTGTFIVNGGGASKIFTLSEDNSKEGTETFKLSVNNGQTFVNVSIIDTSYPPEYKLTSSPANSVNEGGVLVITLTVTPNVPNGTILPYTITGVTSEDLEGASLTGAFIVGTQNTATFNITEDIMTEGVESLTLTLDGYPTSTITVNINDTSQPPIYNLVSSATSVNEGQSVTFTVNTQFVKDGFTFDYIITGVSSEDINGESLTGTITVTSNKASKQITLTNDYTIEGPELITFTVPSINQAVQVAVNDTSVPTYALSTSATTVNEGGSVTITLVTQGVPNGTILNYTISGVTSEDIEGASLTGAFIKGTVDTITINLSSDLTTEGPESLIVSLTDYTASVTVTIVDTSLSPVLRLLAPVYAFNGGQINFKIIANFYEPGTTFNYTISGVSSNVLNNANLSGTLTTSGTLEKSIAELSLNVNRIPSPDVDTVTITIVETNQSITIDIIDYATETYSPNTVLALTGEDIVRQSYIFDQGINRDSVDVFGTMYGSSFIPTSTSPYTVNNYDPNNGFSLYFDTGSYVRTSEVFNFSSNTDFTLEFQLYLTYNVNEYVTLLSTNWLSMRLAISTWGSHFQFSFNGSWYTTPVNRSAFSNTWKHVAFVKSGNSCKVYLDGNLQNLVKTSSPAASYPLTEIGLSSPLADSTVSFGGSTLTGYVYNFKVSLSALYTANFTPSTTSTIDDRTEFYLGALPKFSNLANLGHIKDYGSVEVSNVVTKNNNQSIKFNGANAYLEAVNVLQSGATLTELTIAAWVYPTEIKAGSSIICETYTGSSNPVSFAMYFGSTGTNTIGNYIAVGSFTGSTWVSAQSSYELPLNEWTYVAGVYKNNTWNLFIDGVQVVSSSTLTLPNSINQIFIGRRWDSTAGSNPYFAGYLDDVLIAKEALYETTFLPPGEFYRIISDKAIANEGDTLTITLETNQVADGVIVPYTITGVSSEDINGASLTGAFVVGTQSSITINISKDATTEGVETLTITLDGKNKSVSVTINDTSQPGIYNLSTSATVVNEGDTFTITVTTEFVEDNTLVPYEITGVSSEDIEGLPLLGNLTVISNTATLQITVTNDLSLEGLETLVFTLPDQNLSVSIDINDTSVPTYSLTSSASSISEGQSFTITFTTSGVAAGTEFPYTITGVTSADINDEDLTGKFVIGSVESKTFIATIDNIIDEDTFTLSLDGRTEFVNVTITNAVPPPLYVLTSSAYTVSEGDSVTITLTTENVSNGTIIPYTITGVTSADLISTSLTGSFVKGTIDSVTINIAKDNITEGDELLVFRINGSAASVTIQIIDSSKTPYYELSSSASVVIEGQSFVITLTTVNVDSGTELDYIITGVTSDDIGGTPLTGTFNVINNVATKEFYTVDDQITDGNKTFKLSLSNSTDSFIEVFIYDVNSEQIINTNKGIILSINGDITKGSLVNNNSLIIDSSNNELIVTKNNDVAIGSFTPLSKNDGYWSLHFDGSGDYITVNDSENLELLNNDFTIEGFIYPTANTANTYYTWMFKGPNGNYGTFYFPQRNGKLYIFLSYAGTSWNIHGVNNNYVFGDLIINSWNHFALTRSGDTVRGFINGVLGSTILLPLNQSLVNNSNLLSFGAQSGGSEPAFGYMSNVRIINGVGFYTNNFTVPTTPLKTSYKTLSSLGSQQQFIYSYLDIVNPLDGIYSSSFEIMKDIISLSDNTFNKNVSRQAALETPTVALLTLQSNKFIDNSDNNFSLTSYGNAKILPISPFNFSTYVSATMGGSIYLNGSNNYLSIANNNSLKFQTSDYCIESWIYPLSYSNTPVLFDFRTNNGVSGGALQLSINNSGFINVYGGASTSLLLITSTNKIQLNSWTHIALCRINNSTKLYINGMQSGSEYIDNTNYGLGALWIGALAGGSNNYYNGYYSSTRIVKGSIVYSTTFTPPTGPLSNINNTVLLLNYNNTAVVDSMATANIATAGNVSVGKFTPFSLENNKFSAYFNGTNSYISLSNTTNLAPGTNDFTLEFWCYNTANTWSRYMDFIDAGTGGLAVYPTSSGLFRITRQSVSGAQKDLGSLTSLPLYTWLHFAVVRHNGNSVAYVNGIQLGSPVADTNSYGAFTKIGGTADGYFKGYLSNIRFTNGVALYTSGFTVPLTPSTVTGSETKLLTLQSRTFTDNSGSSVLLTPINNTEISTYSPYGESSTYLAVDKGGSIYLDGTGDYLIINEQSGLLSNITQIDFTIDTWIYPLATPSSRYGIMTCRTNGGNNGWNFSIDSSLKIRFWYGNGTFPTVISSAAIPLRAWTHIAVTRSNTTFNLYINGVNNGTLLNVPNGIVTSAPLIVGAEENLANQFNGYISNTRIILGESVYSSNFNIPETLLPTTKNTVLLLEFNEGGIVDSSYQTNLITYGQTKLSHKIFKDGNGSIYFSGDTDYVNIIGSKLNLESGDFTIDFWFYPLTIKNASFIRGDNNTATNVGIDFGFTINAELFVSLNGTNIMTSSAGIIQPNKWQQISLVRKDNTYTLYYSNIGIGSVTDTTIITTPLNYRIGGSSQSTANSIYGYIDNMIISRTADRQQVSPDNEIYELSVSSLTVNEGDTITVTLITFNVPNGTTVPYTITGISSADINNESLTGSFVVGTKENIILTATADVLTEGGETVTVSLNNINKQVKFTIIDTSQPPIYWLSASSPYINEGDTLTIYLNYKFAETGTILPYVISGVTSKDVGNISFTGNFVVGTTDSVSIPITGDGSEEGNEIITLTIPDLLLSISTVIVDTSKPSYILTSTANNVNEGDTFNITLNTIFIPNDALVPYTITGVTSEDINGMSLTGSFSVVGGTSILPITISNDFIGEGPETLTLTLDNKDVSISVVINDTSAPTYTLTSSSSFVDEGTTVTIYLETTYIADNTLIAYQITGITVDDLDSGSLTGNFTVINNQSSITLNIKNDFLTEGIETINLKLTNTINKESIDVLINDTSIPNWTLYTSTPTVNEGQTVTFNLLGTSDWHFSYNFAGAGNYVTINYDDVLNFGTKNWTIEFWIKSSDSTSTWSSIYGTDYVANDSGYFMIYSRTNGQNIMSMVSNFNDQEFVWSMPNSLNHNDNNWHHVAWVRDGTNIKGFFDGVNTFTQTIDINHVFGVQNRNIYIGYDSIKFSGFTGNLSSIKVTPNNALYNVDFTVTSSVFEIDQTTSLLILNKSRVLDSSINSISTTVVGFVDVSVDGPLNPETLTSTIPNGTRIYYTLSGTATRFDFDQVPALNSYLTVNNGVASVSFTSLINQIDDGLKTFTMTLDESPDQVATVNIKNVIQAAGYKFTLVNSSVYVGSISNSSTGGGPTDWVYANDGDDIWPRSTVGTSGWVGGVFTAQSTTTYFKWFVDDYATIYVNGFKIANNSRFGWNTLSFPTISGRTYYISAYVSDPGQGKRGFVMSVRRDSATGTLLLRTTTTSYTNSGAWRRDG